MSMQLTTMAEDKFFSVTKHMGKWVEQILGRSFNRYCPGESWSPAVNVYEDDVSYTVVADLAGLRVEEIDLRVEKNLLVLSGDRQTPAQPDNTGPVRVRLMEIDHGPFCRSVELPENADQDSVQACYRGGFLWIRLAKRA